MQCSSFSELLHAMSNYYGINVFSYDVVCLIKLYMAPPIIKCIIKGIKEVLFHGWTLWCKQICLTRIDLVFNQGFALRLLYVVVDEHVEAHRNIDIFSIMASWP